MSTKTLSTQTVAAMPRVNLLPPEIAEAQRFRQLQIAMGGAVVVAAVAVAALYVHEKSGVSAAQEQLNAAQAQQTSMQQKLNGLNSVKATYADVAAKQTELATAMGQEIRWSRTLNDLTLRIPSSVWLTGLTATETSVTTNGTAPATTSGAATVGSVGTIAFSGVGMKHDDVATWLDALAREHGFSDPGFSSASETLIGSRKVVDFATSVSLTPQILSNRYSKVAG